MKSKFVPPSVVLPAVVLVAIIWEPVPRAVFQILVVGCPGTHVRSV